VDEAVMVFKLSLEAQKHWRRLQGFELIPRSLLASVSSMAKNKPNRPLNLINHFNKDAPVSDTQHLPERDE
jgi:hypothetical protein